MIEQLRIEGESGIALLEAGQTALDRGDSRAGFELLKRASEVGVAPEHLHRLAQSYAMAARFQGRQADVVGWIDSVGARRNAPPRGRTFCDPTPDV